MSIDKIGILSTEITGVAGFPSKGTLPRARTLTGTFSSVGKIVTGTGTLFSTELGGIKGWLYSTTDNELRPFIGYSSDTILELQTAFTNNQTNQPVLVCAPLYMSIAATSSGSGNAVLNNRTFLSGKVKNFNFSASCSPITYNASGVNQEITFDLAN